MKKENVLFAGKNLFATDIQSKNAAANPAPLHYVGIAGIKSAGEQAVYNMEVDEYHNFSVNGGIIVHNCMDDIRYMAQTVLRYRFADDGYKPRLPL